MYAVPESRRSDGLGDVERARQEHRRQAAQVLPQQTAERPHAVVERLVVVAGGRAADGRRPVRDLSNSSFLTRLACGPPFSASHSANASSPSCSFALEVAERHLGLLALGADEPEHDLVHARAAVIEQALVDVADLLDVEVR